MTHNLPAEVWQDIFSYLDLEDLARARLTSRSWWELINCDFLWKRLLLRRRITKDLVRLDSEDDNCKVLVNCKWAKICFAYYGKVLSNWKKPRYLLTRCPPSTECVIIRTPFMLRTFDPYRVVDVLRLVDCDFVPFARLPLPDDGQEGCLTPHMTSDSVFVVSKNAYSIIFKLEDNQFKFHKAVCLTSNNTFESCCVENDLPRFLRSRPHSDAFFSCCSATEDALWIFEEISGMVYVWNYTKSELTHKLDASIVVFTHSTEKHVYCMLQDQISIHSLDGKRLWLYKQKQALISGFCWDKHGCGFIENRHLTKTAVYLGVTSLSVTQLDVLDPLAISLHEIDRVAYCLCIQDCVASIVCASLVNGACLWETVICSSLNTHRAPFLSVVIEMRVVLGKYISIYGLDGSASNFISSGDLSLYSTVNGQFIWAHSFNPTKIIHLCDHFIITRGRTPRGGLRYSFEIYNFL